MTGTSAVKIDFGQRNGSQVLLVTKSQPLFLDANVGSVIYNLQSSVLPAKESQMRVLAWPGSQSRRTERRWGCGGDLRSAAG